MSNFKISDKVMWRRGTKNIPAEVALVDEIGCRYLTLKFTNENKERFHLGLHNCDYGGRITFSESLYWNVHVSEVRLAKLPKLTLKELL